MWEDAGMGAARVLEPEAKENEMAGNEEFSKGQGKLPREVVVDNALLKPRYEEQELEGNVPVTASIPSSGGVAVQGGSDTRGFVTAEIVGGAPTGNFS